VALSAFAVDNLEAEFIHLLANEARFPGRSDP
jgi:hypothetical protein